MTEGWDAASYGRVAEMAGVRASTLQERVFPRMMAILETSSPQAFEDSWVRAVGAVTSFLKWLECYSIAPSQRTQMRKPSMELTGL